MSEAEPNAADSNVDQLSEVIAANPDQSEADAAKATADAAAATAAGGDGPDESKVIWPEKWREQIAGDDAKVLKRLGRYSDPGQIFNSFTEMETKFKGADIRSPFPDEGSDKDKAAWRKSNDVPAEAAGYSENLPDGLVIGEEDRQGMDTLADAMHAINAPASVTHAAMGAYYQHVETVQAERAQDDVKDKRDSDDALNELYGVDFRRNINDLNSWLDTGPKGMKDRIFSARHGAKMDMLGNDPEFLKFMVGEMRRINPLVTVPGLGGGDPALALADEIASIEKVIKTDNRTYRADKKMKARYLELISARDGDKKRA